MCGLRVGILRRRRPSGWALVLPTWPRRRPPGNGTLSTYAHSSDWGLRSGHASQERAGGGPPGLPRGRVWQAGLRRALPPSAAGARARPMWGACTGGMVFGVVWTCFGTQAGDDFGRDGDRLASMEPCLAVTYLRSRDSGATPPALGPCGCPPPAWGRDQRRRRTAGRADTAAGRGAVPPRGRAPAGRRRRRTAVARPGGARSLTIPNQGLEGRKHCGIDCGL